VAPVEKAKINSNEKAFYLEENWTITSPQDKYERHIKEEELYSRGKIRGISTRFIQSAY
jgi:hypothetical protein